MAVKKLNLTISREWFDMIRSGIKTKEYRKITPYWLQRLTENDFTKDQLREICAMLNAPVFDIQTTIEMYDIKFKEFDAYSFYNGPHFGDNLPHFDIGAFKTTIQEGKPEWGAVPGTRYFNLNLNTIL